MALVFATVPPSALLIAGYSQLTVNDETVDFNQYVNIN